MKRFIKRITARLKSALPTVAALLVFASMAVLVAAILTSAVIVIWEVVNVFL